MVRGRAIASCEGFLDREAPHPSGTNQLDAVIVARKAQFHVGRGQLTRDVGRWAPPILCASYARPELAGWRGLLNPQAAAALNKTLIGFEEVRKRQSQQQSPMTPLLG